MTVRDDLLLIKQTKKDNLDYLEIKVREKKQEFKKLRQLYEINNNFDFADAVKVLDGEETFDAITDENIEEKLTEV